LRIKHGIFLCIPCYNLKNKRLIHAHFLPHYSSSPMSQDPTDKSHFSLKTWPEKFHIQHWVKWTQNNPFIALVVYG
jgi:hypothetical protein